MESELRVSARPELTRPVLVAAFRGWNDGAQAASLAAGVGVSLVTDPPSPELVSRLFDREPGTSPELSLHPPQEAATPSGHSHPGPNP